MSLQGGPKKTPSCPVAYMVLLHISQRFDNLLAGQGKPPPQPPHTSRHYHLVFFWDIPDVAVIFLLVARTPSLITCYIY